MSHRMSVGPRLAALMGVGTTMDSISGRVTAADWRIFRREDRLGRGGVIASVKRSALASSSIATHTSASFSGRPSVKHR